MIYLANSFSLQMLAGDQCITVRKTDLRHVAEKLSAQNYIPAIGHEDLAGIASAMLEKALVPIPSGGLYDRCRVTLHPGDELIVLQVVGQRLPIGCKDLPDGVKLEWFHIETTSPGDSSFLQKSIS